MTGKIISHFKVLDKLGGGGMGVVYRAEDLALGRTVALKFLPPNLTADQEANQRFVQEAKAASALDHPNVCTIYEIGRTEEGQQFIAMAHYEGRTLKERLERGPLSTNEAVDVARQLADGLGKAHAKGIVHRDVKPANIIITDEGRAIILDFGLAKLAGTLDLTKTGSTVGTTHYMSPEQLRAEALDHRTDIWSLGIVLYEMLTGRKPFEGDYEQAITYAILNEDPAPLADVHGAVEPTLERIVSKAISKDVDARYQAASEVLGELRDFEMSGGESEPAALVLDRVLHRLRKPQLVVPSLAVVVMIAAGTVWFVNRQAKIRWARTEALPEIERLVENSWRDLTEAYELAEKAEQYIPHDPKLADLLSRSSLNVDVETSPVGAQVYLKRYSDPNSEWRRLGVSPLTGIRLPVGIFRWKIDKAAYEPVLAASSTWDVRPAEGLLPVKLVRSLDKEGTIPPGMVRVSGGETPGGRVGDFFIDKYEVTNQQYKEFVVSGGYRKKEFWKYEFLKSGELRSWGEAMAEFVDQTGRPGPATWRAGDYPEGKGDHPVAGVSWYEAAAYAEFAGKRLPTVYHWGLARGEATPMVRWPQLGGAAVLAPLSNFGGEGPVAVGSLGGITPYGAHDMAGNVREWCSNETPGGRAVRGGAWNDNPYMFKHVSSAPPFDRSSRNGFRSVLNHDPEEIPLSVFGKVEFDEGPNYYEQEPVGDEIFRIYREQFGYDAMPLDAEIEFRNESAEDWIHERVAYSAAYGGEQIIAHLFLPRIPSPPYSAIVYFPGSGSTWQESSEHIEDYLEFRVFLSFIVKNGRAVLYPVYKGTFERHDAEAPTIHLRSETHQYTDYVIRWVKDFRRSVDYLETRPDIDSEKLAYYGMSWGGALGAIIPAVEERIKASVLVAGGLRPFGRPEVRSINYISRVKAPTLMINGRYDTLFSLERDIKPMFDLMGTPEENKALKLYETDHIPPRIEFIKESLAWFDRYLGPVR